MEETLKELDRIINEIEWGIERNRRIRFSKHDYRIILLIIKGYLEIRKNIYDNQQETVAKIQ